MGGGSEENAASASASEKAFQDILEKGDTEVKTALDRKPQQRQRALGWWKGASLWLSL